MDNSKPWALISEVGEHGYFEELVDIMKQQFNIICLQDLLQNPQLYGPRIQTLFLWNTRPLAEPSLLRLLPSLKVVANGGVGIDHLDVPHLNSLGVKVSNTPHVVADATADIAMSLLLASARNVVEGEANCSTLEVFHPARLQTLSKEQCQLFCGLGLGVHNQSASFKL